MTKKYFIEFANNFKIARNRCKNNTEKLSAVDDVIEDFCVSAKKFNNNFDKATFLKACGVNED